tara:strand:+ start:465 stop:1481 length:1017 start_codon:yes stop_codon:yes gene_type:complete
MHLYFPVFAILCAVCASLIGKLLRVLRPVAPRTVSNTDTVFVGLVSYCDTSWPAQVQQMIDAAGYIERVCFGVLEFVESANDTCEASMPTQWRSFVRVHTVSAHIASSQRRARQLCFEKTYRDEAYVLFCRSVDMVPCWDEFLVDNCGDTGVVVSTSIDTSETVATYPSVRFQKGALRVVSNYLQVYTDHTVPSIMFQHDMLFCRAQAVDLALSNAQPLEVSASLVRAGYELVVPGKPLAVRAQHPRGVKCGDSDARAPSSTAAAYALSVGIDFGTYRTTAKAKLGLTPQAEASESISKYGSVVASRVAHQTLEAKRKSRRCSTGSQRQHRQPDICGM